MRPLHNFIWSVCRDNIITTTITATVFITVIIISPITVLKTGASGMIAYRLHCKDLSFQYLQVNNNMNLPMTPKCQHRYIYLNVFCLLFTMSFCSDLFPACLQEQQTGLYHLNPSPPHVSTT